MNGPRILVVGYSGANNTGAEALLRADLEDLRAVLGKGVRITIPAHASTPARCSGSARGWG